MPNYILFNKTPEELRRLGARGGKAFGHNQRARRALLLASQASAAPDPLRPGESAAEAIAVLDAQFPWLRGVEQRPPANRLSRPGNACAADAAHRQGRAERSASQS